jgi:hypothetical protein
MALRFSKRTLDREGARTALPLTQTYTWRMLRWLNLVWFAAVLMVGSGLRADPRLVSKVTFKVVDPFGRVSAEYPYHVKTIDAWKQERQSPNQHE